MKSKVFFGVFPFIFSIVVAFPVILPYLNLGYFPTHDGEWAVVRLGEMFRELRDLQIPPRYSENLNFGYGYPLFNFAYPFPYYLGTFIHFLGFGFVDSIKILFAASVPLSAFFMFLASRILWKNVLAGIISAIIYVYFPYRMVDLYVRGSIGESLSFVLFPLLFYLAIKLVDKASSLLVGGIAISVGILIMTHNIMTVLFMPVFIIFMMTHIILNKKKIIKPFIVSIILGLGLSAFFWIPALFEKSNILLSQIPIADRNLHFVNLSQFIFPRWGYGVPTDPNGFSYQLGIPHLIVLFLTVFVLLFRTSHSGPSAVSSGQSNCLSRISLTPFLLIAVILVFTFLLFKQSAFLWDNLPLLSEINYPWISLGILGFLVSLLAGFLCRQNLGRYTMIFLGIAAVAFVLPYAKPEYYFNKGDDYYLTNDATTTSSNELMPLWVKKFPSERPTNKVETVKGIGKVSNTLYGSKEITFDVLAKENMIVRVNTIYYPGWKAFVYPSPCHPDQAQPEKDPIRFRTTQGILRRFAPQNDNCISKAVIDYSNDKGVMELGLPKGENKVELKFSETPLRLFADLLSLLSFVALIFFVIAFSPKRSKIKARNIEVAKLFHL